MIYVPMFYFLNFQTNQDVIRLAVELDDQDQS